MAIRSAEVNPAPGVLCIAGAAAVLVATDILEWSSSATREGPATTYLSVGGPLPLHHLGELGGNPWFSNASTLMTLGAMALLLAGVASAGVLRATWTQNLSPLVMGLGSAAIVCAVLLADRASWTDARGVPWTYDLGGAARWVCLLGATLGLIGMALVLTHGGAKSDGVRTEAWDGCGCALCAPARAPAEPPAAS
jgi:hypothetical protein